MSLPQNMQMAIAIVPFFSGARRRTVGGDGVIA
jgi:hypothetical protein